jgi:hypothetical protein
MGSIDPAVAARLGTTAVTDDPRMLPARDTASGDAASGDAASRDAASRDAH